MEVIVKNKGECVFITTEAGGTFKPNDIKSQIEFYSKINPEHDIEIRFNKKDLAVNKYDSEKEIDLIMFDKWRYLINHASMITYESDYKFYILSSRNKIIQ